jgi:hypothetical protein
MMSNNAHLSGALHNTIPDDFTPTPVAVLTPAP